MLDADEHEEDRRCLVDGCQRYAAWSDKTGHSAFCPPHLATNGWGPIPDDDAVPVAIDDERTERLGRESNADVVGGCLR